MIKKFFLSILSLPFLLITSVRNFLYDIGFFNSYEFNIPIISVGNLVLGGTGKTPITEYLIRLLSDKYKVAVLSRGYGRKSNDFILASSNTNADIIGDEPMQYYRKYNNITISVDSNRVRGIKKLNSMNINPQVILLDDAYQHRKVKPKISILLTDYNNLYCDDNFFPFGNLREGPKNACRADIVLVTKCNENLNENEKIKVTNKLNLSIHQKIFFSSVKYLDILCNEEGQIQIDEFKNKKFTLLTGIANHSYLVNYLKNKGYDFNHISFNDHHNYSDNDIRKLNFNEVIITTEKDYVKLYERIRTKLFFK